MRFEVQLSASDRGEYLGQGDLDEASLVNGELLCGEGAHFDGYALMSILRSDAESIAVAAARHAGAESTPLDCSISGKYRFASSMQSMGVKK